MNVQAVAGPSGPAPTPPPVHPADPPDAAPPRLRLLGGFDLTSGGTSLGVGAQRLLALLAVHGRALTRRQAAHALWPDTTASRANANLRSALWRLQRVCPDAVRVVGPHRIELTTSIPVDLHGARDVARALLDLSRPLTLQELGTACRTHLEEDLLPDWPDEDWLASEREQFRHLRVHALESLCHQLSAAGWHGAAVQAGLAAVRSDPFRESAHHALIDAYLAEGNTRDARDQHQRCAALLRDELGVEPALSPPVFGASRPGNQRNSRSIGHVTAQATRPSSAQIADARFLRVLSDPTRLAIIEHLLTGPLTVGELVDKIGGPQSRISNHLACLRWCQFVNSERQGRQVRYSITDPRLGQLLDLTHQLVADKVEHLASCTRIGPQWT